MCNRNIVTVVLAVTLFGIALGAGSSYSLIVNGQTSKGTAIGVAGKTYVPLTVLKSLGITSSLKGTTLTLSNTGSNDPPANTTAGGTNQRASLEGCIGETLFNGVWRLTLTATKPISRYNGQQPGYNLNLEWKNGTKTTANALNTGVKSLNLVLEDGTVLQSEDVQTLTNKSLPQGAGVALELAFYAESGTPADKLSKPAKFLVEIDPKVLVNTGVSVVYSTPTPSFRVRLDCQK
jgi:hypothetical protein